MAQARTEFAAALNQIASEKGVDVSVVIEAIEAAALAAYRKDLSLRNEPIPEEMDEYQAKVDPVTGEISVFKDEENVTPPGFARIAASIARQVILQKLHEAERGAIMSEYAQKVGTVISGSIQRQEGNTFFIDLGRAEGVLPPPEQTQNELYHSNQRLKFYIKEIRESSRGPEVIVSRSDANLVKGLFAMEVPEIQSGAVEVKVVAREAGGRTKIAAVSTQEGVDPVGSLVGQKGIRVQKVMEELGEEKIDIISYSDDPTRFIASALSPAKEVQVKLNQEVQVATVTVPQSQLSLAIGKGGQNVRLAAKLTGWKIDIEGGEEEITEGTGEKKEDVGVGQATTDDKQSLRSDDLKQSLPSDKGKKKTNKKATKTKEETLEPETAEEGEEKAETEATDPEKSKEEAVVEAVEENITQAGQEESKGGELEEEEDQPAEPQAAADAEADIEKSEELRDKSSE